MPVLACSIHGGSERTVKTMIKTMTGGKPESVLSRDGIILATAGGAVTQETPDGAQVIIYNGTLYNRENLKPLIKPKPKGDTDADIILALYKMKGRKCVHYLDGAFAFVLVDGKDFYAARDPLGAKPLYFAKNGDGYLFASELKAFPADIKKVSEFPIACYFDSESGARRYFKLPDAPSKQVNVPEAVELIRMLVTESTHKQLNPLGEVGIYLTGSLESCIIAALASEKLRKIKTFSVGLAGSADANTAKRVASWLSTDHTHIEITQQDMLDSLQHVVHALETFDAGLVRHAIADNFAVKGAAQQTKKLISGDGANELFGGYAYLRPMFSEKLTHEIRAITDDLHRTNLLRWDRITSMYGVEGRVPFADRKLLQAAFFLPANLKINEEGRSKWILRRAFSTLLPAWVVDRPDTDDTLHQGIQFALQEYADSVFTDEDLSSAQKAEPAANIRTKDELLYYQIWSAKFPPEYVSLVGRTQF